MLINCKLFVNNDLLFFNTTVHSFFLLFFDFLSFFLYNNYSIKQTCHKGFYKIEMRTIMQKQQNTQIYREQRNISRYTGLLISRITLMVCLFFLLIFLRPFSFYFFALLLLYPWIISNILTGRKKFPKPLLASCAKKYFYTPERFTAEKQLSYYIIFALVVWQAHINTKPLDIVFLNPAPGFLLFIYLISRILATAITSRNIYNYYTSMEILDRD